VNVCVFMCDFAKACASVLVRMLVCLFLVRLSVHVSYLSGVLCTCNFCKAFNLQAGVCARVCLCFVLCTCNFCNAFNLRGDVCVRVCVYVCVRW
jgi:hypothetical protein